MFLLLLQLAHAQAPEIVVPDTLDFPGHIPMSAYVEEVDSWPSLSPGGSWILWTFPLGETSRIAISPADGSAAPHTLLESVRRVSWADDDHLFVSLADAGKLPIWRLLDVRDSRQIPVGAPGERMAVYGPDRVSAGAVLGVSRAGNRNRVLRIDGATGAATQLWEGPANGGLLFDPADDHIAGIVRYNVVQGDETEPQWVASVIVESLAGGHLHTLLRTGPPGHQPFSVVRTGVHDGKILVISELDTDKASVESLDLSNGHREVLVKAKDADITRVLLTGDDEHVAAVAEDVDRLHWRVIDPAVQRDIDRLEAGLDGDWYVVQSSPSAWLVYDEAPTHAGWWYLYQRASGTLRRLDASGPFDAFPWRPMQALRFAAKDGFPLTGYLTTPDPGRYGAPPYPVVVSVHGGPWFNRDEWGWDFYTQRLADLGYAVLAVNFRGSSGFGKGSGDYKATEGEWGGAMSTDLLDGVVAATALGQVDPSRAAILGTSYGGYAALAGATLEPGTWRCAVAAAADGSLLQRSLRFGGLYEPELGPRAYRAARSPDHHADAIVDPLLVWIGRKDPIVPWPQIARFVRRVEAVGAPATVLLSPSGRHGPQDPPGLLAWEAVAETFLAGCLRGDAPPLKPAVAQSDLRALYGAERVPGLVEALATETSR